MKKNNLEALVGLFVVLALVTLMFMVFFVSGVHMFQKGYNIHVLFNHVSKLNTGAEVRLSGIPVGTLHELEIFKAIETKTTKVRATLFIREGIEISRDSVFRIEGIYGLSIPHLEIDVSDETDGNYLVAGDTVNGVDPMPLEDLVVKGKSIVEQMANMVARVNEFLKDQEMGQAFRDSIVQFSELTKRLSAILETNEGDLESTMGKLQESAGHLQSVLKRLDEGEGTAGKLLSDEALYREIEEFVKEIKRNPWKLLKKRKE